CHPKGIPPLRKRRQRSAIHLPTSRKEEMQEVTIEIGNQTHIMRRTPFNGKRIKGHVCGAGLTMDLVKVLDGLVLESPVRKKPRAVKWAELGLCYDNAQELAKHPRYTYVQGLALLSSSEGIWRGHGWCIDSEGYVVDNTWRTPGERYIGIPGNIEDEREAFIL